jgi:hypothetical protein
MNFASEPSGFATLGNASEAAELCQRVVTGIAGQDKVSRKLAAQDANEFLAQRAAQQC